MVHDGTVIVTDSTNNKIWYFDENLIPLAPPSYQGAFIGPRRFLGASDIQGIYVTDERNVPEEDRLAFMRDIFGGGWTTFGSTGSGVGQFQFFSVP